MFGSHRTIFWFYTLLQSTCLSAQPSFVSKGLIKLKLVTAETRTIEAFEGADAVVSRKGIIDLLAIADGKWQVTGLRQGVVVIDFENSDTEEKSRYVVEVIKKDLDEKSKQTSHSFPVQICRTKVVVCNLDASTISGVISSFALWNRIRKACANGTCFFDATLTESAKLEFRNYLQSLLPPSTELLLSRSGPPLIKAFCSEKSKKQIEDVVNYLTNGMIEDGSLFVVCASENPSRLFLQAKAFLVDTSRSDLFGIQLLNNGSKAIEVPQKSVNLAALISSKEFERNAKIIAEPMLNLTPGVEIKVKSGDEFRVMYETGSRDRPEKEGWKEAGFELRFKAESPILNKSRITYEITLRSRGAASSSKELLVTSLSASSDIELNKGVIVGVSDVVQDSTSFTSDFSFANIPIIGPLFKTSLKDEARSKLYFWVLLSMEDLISKISLPESLHR